MKSAETSFILSLSDFEKIYVGRSCIYQMQTVERFRGTDSILIENFEG